MKRWMSALPYLSSVDTYARKVLELCTLLHVPIPPGDAEAVIHGSASASFSDSADFGAAPLLGLCTVESLLYHHVCGHITQIGVKTVPPHAILSDHVSITSFVADFSRVLLGTDHYRDAKASDAPALFEDAVALYAVCHVYLARVVEQFTRFTGVAGPVGSGVSSVLRSVAGIEEREGGSVTRSVLGNTVVRELPFTLPHLLLALNLFHSVSIVVVLEDADCAANGTVADVLEAMGSLCATRRSRKQHVGVFISKLDEYLRRHPTAKVPVDSADDADGMGSLKLTSAAVALAAMKRIQQNSPTNPCWDHVAAVAGAVMPRVDVPGIPHSSFVEHATNALRVSVLASNV
uniref:Uncharacterized protein n=2 Tax=Neobodo designis TaxID=312471 RepID=A0A7S1MRJ3_NEODS